MTRTDIAIIGSGPAGLEAALTARNRNKTITVYGSSDLSVKMQAIDHPITNYLGLSNMTGKQMAETFQKQLKDAGIEITEKRITTVYAMGDFFGLQTSGNEMTEASTVILATGVTAGNPYPGETEYLGRGVSYCATCDAPLAISGGMKADTLKTNQNEYHTDCIFILRESQFPSQLVPGLKVEGNAVVIDRLMHTNIPGLFAAGDITGLPYQFIKSAGEGNIAAISASMYLDQKRKG